jgi:N-acetylglucosamine kinase-like BadF-type ATPase
LPVVLSTADAGDETARAVLTQAGAELATLATIVIARLFGNAEVVPVAISGGVFCHSAVVRQVFEDRLRIEFPEILLSAKVIDPATGALELARKKTKP